MLCKESFSQRTPSPTRSLSTKETLLSNKPVSPMPLLHARGTIPLLVTFGCHTRATWIMFMALFATQAQVPSKVTRLSRYTLWLPLKASMHFPRSCFLVSHWVVNRSRGLEAFMKESRFFFQGTRGGFLVDCIFGQFISAVALKKKKTFSLVALQASQERHTLAFGSPVCGPASNPKSKHTNKAKRFS